VASAAKLEAKRAKKRKWKELLSEQKMACADMADMLRDKQFAIEKAVLRFAATDARLQAVEMFEDGQKHVHKSISGTQDGASLSALERTLAQRQLERQELQQALQNAKMVRHTLR